MKVNRLATFLNLNSSMKVPITTVWLGAVRVAMPLLALGPLRSPREGIAPGANASAPTRAETTTKALVNMLLVGIGATSN